MNFRIFFFKRPSNQLSCQLLADSTVLRFSKSSVLLEYGNTLEELAFSKVIKHKCMPSLRVRSKSYLSLSQNQVSQQLKFELQRDEEKLEGEESLNL